MEVCTDSDASGYLLKPLSRRRIAGICIQIVGHWEALESRNKAMLNLQCI